MTLAEAEQDSNPNKKSNNDTEKGQEKTNTTKSNEKLKNKTDN